MSNETRPKVAALLAGIATLVVLITARFLYGAIEQGFALQFGGVENYKIAKQLYTHPTVVEQQKNSLDAALKGVESGKAPTQDNTAQQPSSPNTDASGTLSADKLASVKDYPYVLGNKDAKISIIEYSDPECPYCVYHHQNGTIDSLVAQYNGNVNHITKVVEGVNHEGTEYKSVAALCAWQLGGAEAYYGMLDKIATNTVANLSQNQFVVSPVADVPTYAKELGLDEAKFASCVDKKETLSQYAANWSEFRSFTSQPGTPGNLILNNETGEWKLAMGALSASSLKEIIDSMIN